ncbi:FAT domain-containing protein, partial [Helicosporidium sp. ATCC 50920]
KVLGVLIGAAPKLVLPYTQSILNMLVVQLQAGSRQGPLLHADGAAKLPAAGAWRCTPQDDGLQLFLLATMGELARVAGSHLREAVPQMLPLIIEAMDEGGSTAKHLVAVNTLGQVVESTGIVVSPYNDYPQLLGMLLRMLSDGGPALRREVMKVLGIVGALDPHAHKLNLAALQGEGKLESEGVRPHQYRAKEAKLPGAPAADSTLDLLPSAGLVTSSEDYYPTVAINALMRVLRNPGLASLHGRAVHALFDIIRAMALNFVLYLPKVVPVLLQLTREADDLQRRVDMVRALTDLVVLMRQHVSKFLPDLLALIHDFWGSSSFILPHVLTLLSELAHTLRDDFHSYMPDLLPRFVVLFDESERTGDFAMVSAALDAIKAFGPVLEDSLQLLLPVLVRIIMPGASLAPVGVQEECLESMQELFPQMQLAGYSSTVMHPLMRLLDGPSEELRERAVDTICSLALAVGPDFAIFVPTVRKIMARHQMSPHPTFLRITSRVLQQEQPCMSDAEDWESSTAFLAEEHLPRGGAGGERPSRALALPPPAEERCEDEQLSAATRQEGLNSLRRAWESSQRSTKEDWAEWMRNFSIELLKQSPSKALRACGSLAQANPSMGRELFAAGFVSCWSELDEGMQEQLVRSLEAALASPTIPPDIVTTLLNLAEFMEHDEKALPLDTRTLGALAEKCHAYAKALHYKEIEFQTSPHTAVEALISINNHLRQPDAAVGILNVAQKDLHMELKESWYEKLHRWEDALRAYRRRLETVKPGTIMHVEALLGQCRCLAALAQWEELFDVCRSEWNHLEPQVRRELAPIAAHAAWQLGDWMHMQQYVDIINVQASNNSEGAFLSAVLDVRHKDYDKALEAVERSRDLLGTELAALVGESYERAYGDMVRVQQLTELEEILTVRLAEKIAETTYQGDPAIVGHTKLFTQDMWQGRLKGVQRNVEVWQAIISVRKLLLKMHEDVPTWIKFASLCRKSGRIRQSEDTLKRLLKETHRDENGPAKGLNATTQEPVVLYAWHKHRWATNNRQDAFMGMQELAQDLSVSGSPAEQDFNKHQLAAKINLKLGLWRRALTDELAENTIASVMTSLKTATEFAPGWGKAWHHWALFNVEAMGFYGSIDPEAAKRFVAPAITGFFRSIELGQATAGAQQVGQTVIARIHANSYPSQSRRDAAMNVMENVRQHSATLVEQAHLVSQELIRMAVLWHEQWHESLEEASRLYFGESNVEGMLETLLPLHEEMHKHGPTTLQEIAFNQTYGRELEEAYEWCKKYKQSRKEAELHQAWDLYYHVFKRINKQLPLLTTLELQYVAPALVRAKNLELAVPGTYVVGEDLVTIECFMPQLHVITSKQRPRKLTIQGSDGADYMFLLKGHEDLRQDERVMQLFGLVNNMLVNDRITAERDLTIARYAVIPLSPNSGLIGWVPNTDTLHSLIREYRDARKIPLNVEHRLMLGMAPDYDHLTVIQKVEVFQHALDSTSGDDLHKVLWLKSRNSEAWLDKRTNYTRSTAAMSMVGYILGLGDRHPSNLMLDRYSGKLLHIDFGDCFEASMLREKFPERVPFRLTRMMIKAFEVSGIEGNFRYEERCFARCLF